MPQDHSFDVVSQFDRQELVNAVDQARREITTRYDFKGITVEITLESETITLLSGTEAQLKSIVDVLQTKAHRRDIDLKVLDPQKPEPAAKGNVRQVVKLRQGIGEELARDLNKRIRAQHPKAQVRTQGDQLRVSSKDKDELQSVIQQLRDTELDVPLRLSKAEMDGGRGVEAVLDLVRSEEKVVSAALGPNQSKAFLDRVSQLMERSIS